MEVKVVSAVENHKFIHLSTRFDAFPHTKSPILISTKLSIFHHDDSFICSPSLLLHFCCCSNQILFSSSPQVVCKQFFLTFSYCVRQCPNRRKMDSDYFNSSTLSSLLGESTTTEKSNSDILNDTIQTFQKVISAKDMVRVDYGGSLMDFL